MQRVNSHLITLLFTAFLCALIIPSDDTNDFLEKQEAKSVRWAEQHPQEVGYLHLDKPIYRPGDDIWYSAYLLDQITHQATAKSDIVTVELLQPDGSVMETQRLVAIDGNAAGDLTLKANAPGGIYKLRISSRWMKNFGRTVLFEKDVPVQQSIMPRLSMNLDFERRAYGPGDQVFAKLSVASPGEGPLVNQEVRYQIDLGGNRHQDGTITTNGNGLAWAYFTLPEELDHNDGLLNFIISYDGQPEGISRQIPIVLNDIDLQFFPEGGALVSGVRSRLAFKALNEFGLPADIDGVIEKRDGTLVTTFRSYHDGMGAIDFQPESGEKYRARIVRPEGITQPYELPEIAKTGYAMRVLETTEKHVHLSWHAPANGPISLISQVRGKIYFQREIESKVGHNEAYIPLADFPIGIAQISLFDKDEILHCERLAFVNHDRKLDISITTDQNEYQPREKVKLNVEVKDEKGKPAPAHLSLSVVNDRVVAYADDKSDNMLSHLLMSDELAGDVYEPSFYFDESEPKAKQALDYLLLTQGWRDFYWQEFPDKEKDEVALEFVAEEAIIRGQVFDNMTHNPKSGTVVTILETEETVKTDRDGRFEFKNIDLSTPRTLKVMGNNQQYQLASINEYAQDYVFGRKIRGVVTDRETGESVPFANVFFEGTNVGSTTDFDGLFEIKNIPENAEKLVITMIGYKKQVVDISSRRGEMLKIEMTEDAILLESVEIVAYEVPMLSASETRLTTSAPSKRERTKRRERKPKVDNTPPVKTTPAKVEEAEVELSEDVAMTFDEVLFAPAPNAVEEAIADEPVLFMLVEEAPEFPGGESALFRFLSNEVKYPAHCVESSIQGVVYLSFVVAADGEIEQVQVLRGIHPDLDREAMRALEKMPAWKPAEQRGIKVPVRYNMPVRFSLNGSKRDNGPTVISHDLTLYIANNTNHGSSTRAPRYHRARKFYVPKYTSREKVEQRTDFRETIYWNPDLQISASGKAEVEFYNNDETALFRITAEGFGGQGLIGRSTMTYSTKSPFVVQMQVPTAVGQGDQITVPVLLKNNGKRSVTGNFEVSLPDGFEPAGNWPESITLAADSFQNLLLPVNVTNDATPGPFSVWFDARGFTENATQQIEVARRGFPVSTSFSSGTANSTYDVKLNDVIAGSMNAQLSAWPGLVSQLLSGVEGMLRKPYGCFEQTSSSTFPNILALQYMEESQQVNLESRAKAMKFIEAGYERLLTFECKGDGFDWFGNGPAHTGLTAYGLLEFHEMKKVYPKVGQRVIDRTRKFLLSQRDGNGNFKNPSTRSSFGGNHQEIMNAYVTWALSECGEKGFETEYKLAVAEAMQSEDPYRLALMALAADNLNDRSNFQRLIKPLKRVLNKSPEDYGCSGTLTTSYGTGVQTEVMALGVMALLRDPQKDISVLTKLEEQILTRRSGASFGSTQATILSLMALTDYSKFARAAQEPGTVKLLVDGKVVEEKSYAKDHQGVIVFDGWSDRLTKSKHRIEVKFEGTRKSLPYEVELNWQTLLPPSSNNCLVELKTQLAKTEVKRGESVRLEAILRNRTEQNQPSPMAVIGIPAGTTLQQWQLKELVEKGVVEFYEIKGNYLFCYFTSIEAGAEKRIPLDLRADVPGQYTAPASSAYLYYTDDDQDWESGNTVAILE